MSFAVEKHHNGAAASTTADSSTARVEQSLTFCLKAQRVMTKHLRSWQCLAKQRPLLLHACHARFTCTAAPQERIYLYMLQHTWRASSSFLLSFADTTLSPLTQHLIKKPGSACAFWLNSAKSKLRLYICSLSVDSGKQLEDASFRRNKIITHYTGRPWSKVSLCNVIQPFLFISYPPLIPFPPSPPFLPSTTTHYSAMLLDSILFVSSSA